MLVESFFWLRFLPETNSKSSAKKIGTVSQKEIRHLPTIGLLQKCEFLREGKLSKFFKVTFLGPPPTLGHRVDKQSIQFYEGPPSGSEKVRIP